MNEKPEEIEKVAMIFSQLGADESAAPVMAAQLLKRARQLAEEKGLARTEALQKLLDQVVEARQQ